MWPSQIFSLAPHLSLLMMLRKEVLTGKEKGLWLPKRKDLIKWRRKRFLLLQPKTANLNIDPEDHVRQQVPKSTKKSTSYAVNLFNSTMKVVAERLNFQHRDLKDISFENLPWRHSKFLMVVTKSDGSSFNFSSLETIYASLARYLSTEYEPKLH